ncbi:MAG TPA: phosphohistidine phosphatase SixA [Terriglobia bacterium]|nr:phosphohistidine phosphatase SixA [Terriglobia bacterium]
MEIYILRHGIAVERGTPGYKKDSDRPLTSEGEEKVHPIAGAMLAMELKFDLVLSSPYERAARTAQIVADELGEDVTFTKFLEPEGNPLALIGQINDEKPQRVLLVGHEPDLSRLISLMISGGTDAAIELKKGGICKMTAEKLSFGRCATLNWLLTPKQLRTLR